jgi:hypothetical protein
MKYRIRSQQLAVGSDVIIETAEHGNNHLAVVRLVDGLNPVGIVLAEFVSYSEPAAFSNAQMWVLSELDSAALFERA